ncbi:histidine phosphatase family protein [Corynebacterium uterequi]|uniref:Fructose-2,6-bisphosphatase n=1 Tax=Corynebacterium uterequi TaxID=1072256 RepID=A0A0G3HF10_9CORY|nr:histidine phosphatase family protein [Corynebacterium uterequi]AKK11936.1 fructose-2,6-bisphosphatase [Corynebacterium uterequi]
MTELFLVRHGETDWSRTGRHTSFTDLDLTERGVEQALSLNGQLKREDFGLAFTSPRLRARHTAELAGFGDAVVDEDLREWDYGQYEGKTPAEIAALSPGWKIWSHGAPEGESVDEVSARLDRFIDTVRASGEQRVIVFAHGHSLRALTTRWLGLPMTMGAAMPLETGHLSVLGDYKGVPALLRWNA